MARQSVTPAYVYLLNTLKEFLKAFQSDNDAKPVLLNIGAGTSNLIELRLSETGVGFECDRIDIEKAGVSGYGIRNVYQCSVEDMRVLESAQYDAAFANYVLEHVPEIDKAASEIFRVLKPGGLFVTSVPNPTAPEMLISRMTPLWIHKMIAGRNAFETHYSFNNIDSLCRTFERCGFARRDVYYRSYLYGYVERFPLINKIASLYDWILNRIGTEKCLDYVCVVVKKQEGYPNRLGQ